MLFYIDQDFENVSEIEDQTALLAGLADIYELQEAEKIYGYGVNYTIWNDYLIEMQRTLPVAKIEKHAQKILTGYELPVLDSQMLFENLDKRYLYDHKQAQVIVSDLMTELGRNSMDIYLVPLRMDEQSIRLARVPVRLTYWENYYDMVRAASIVLNDGTLLPESYDYYSLFERVTEVQDQLELFDVSLNEKGQISAVKKVNNPKEADKQNSLSNDQFMLTENGTNSLYTLRDTDQTAWIFNSQMQTLSTMSSNYSNYAQLHSSLSENEQWIVIEVENNIGKWRWLFDKQSGELLSDGLLNERYFNGQLTEIIAKNASDAGYPACPVVYEENLTVEKCAVYPYVVDYGAKELLAATPTMFTISENGQLQITLNTRRYGGLAEPLVLELEP